ncbi:MAG TPA: UvrD-helicase domain-containing protein, partial [Spirochaetota bacterium]|nr:UvrD-helicase domain-containing protein [Spirochaetota bacterium]
MDFIDQLNPNQREAVLHTEGPLLILAGAGSGKTRVITYRIAHLIKNKLVPPYAIFAVTFTNKAAEEMRKRIMTIAGPVGESVFIRTFHAAAVYILRRHGAAIGLPGNFSIFDAKDQAALVKEILLELRIDPKKFTPASLTSKISEIKDKAELYDGADPVA